MDLDYEVKQDQNGSLTLYPSVGESITLNEKFSIVDIQKSQIVISFLSNPGFTSEEFGKYGHIRLSLDYNKYGVALKILSFTDFSLDKPLNYLYIDVEQPDVCFEPDRIVITTKLKPTTNLTKYTWVKFNPLQITGNSFSL